MNFKLESTGFGHRTLYCITFTGKNVKAHCLDPCVGLNENTHSRGKGGEIFFLERRLSARMNPLSIQSALVAT